MNLTYKGIDIFYTDEGSGETIVLIHGFLEDHSMWDTIKPHLVNNHRVITLDQPGHGKTACLSDVHTMDGMAEVVEALLTYLGIDKMTLIGHSMGGYVALAYAKKHANKVNRLCLMNSTFEADDDELKERRSKANKMVRDNFESMVRVSFANLFSEESKVTHKQEFEAALKIALRTSVPGYIAAQEGMKLRYDSTSFFLDAPFKKSLILGKKDAVLNPERLMMMAHENDIPYTVLSEGHMSHIENKTECIAYIMHFIENI